MPKQNKFTVHLVDKLDKKKLINALMKRSADIWKEDPEPLASQELLDLVKAIKEGEFDVI